MGYICGIWATEKKAGKCPEKYLHSGFKLRNQGTFDRHVWVRFVENGKSTWFQFHLLRYFGKEF